MCHRHLHAAAGHLGHPQHQASLDFRLDCLPLTPAAGEWSLDGFIKHLNENPLMEQKRKIMELRCKACGDKDENVDETSMCGIKKLWFLPHLVEHFRNKHPELD